MIASLLLAPIARAQQPPPAAPPGPYPYPAVYPAYPLPPYRPLVFSASKEKAELQVERPDRFGELDWYPVCKGSCTTWVVPGASYRVGGSGVTPSRNFVVEPGPYPTYVRASVGSSTARLVGYVMIPAGGVVASVGLVMISFSDSCDGCSDRDRTSGLKEGGTVMLIGAGLVTAGIILLVTQRTELDYATAPARKTSGIHSSKRFELTNGGFRF